jgi:hypothetical protein
LGKGSSSLKRKIESFTRFRKLTCQYQEYQCKMSFTVLSYCEKILEFY